MTSSAGQLSERARQPQESHIIYVVHLPEAHDHALDGRGFSRRNGQTEFYAGNQAGHKHCQIQSAFNVT